jgi:hypothetical protein
MTCRFILLLLIMISSSARSNDELSLEWDNFTQRHDVNAKGGLQLARKFFDDKINQIPLNLKRSSDYYNSLDESVKWYVISSIMAKAIQENDFVTLQIILTTCPQKYIWDQKTWYALCALDSGVMFYSLFSACAELDQNSDHYRIVREIIIDSMPKKQFPEHKDQFLEAAKSSFKSITGFERLITDFTFISQAPHVSEYGIEDFINFFEIREAKLIEIRNANKSDN